MYLNEAERASYDIKKCFQIKKDLFVSIVYIEIFKHLRFHYYVSVY